MKRLPGDAGLIVPDDFDVPAFVSVAKVAAAYSQTHAATHRSFAAAWNGLSHRYRAADELNQDFVAAMAAGDGPPMEDRHRQEHALFAFASTALSSLECLCFGAYCLGALGHAAAFSISHERDLRFYPADVERAFAQSFPTAKLTGSLSSLLAASEFKDLTDLRNVLSHRGTLPRSFFLSVGGGPAAKTGAYVPSNPKSLSSDWVFDRAVDKRLTQSLRDWLGVSLADLLPATSDFADSYLKKTTV